MRTFVAVITLLLILVGVGFLANFGEQSTSFFKNRGEKEKQEDISLLILGRVAEGQGGRWHAAPNLVDAIVIVQYSPEKRSVSLVSLPRDLYGEFGGNSFKINEIYSRKKIDEFMEKLPEITGIEVENYLIVDVEIIKAAVDNLGGIDIELADTITDPVSGFKLVAGEHHLNGEDAVWVMRNRSAPGGDFFREKNQHSVIESIFDAFGKLSPVDKTKFLLSMVSYAESAETNFSIGELAPQFGNVKELTFNSVTLDFSTGLLRSSYVPVGTKTVTTTIDGVATTTATSLQAYVLIPKDGINDYGAIRSFIEEKLQ